MATTTPVLGLFKPVIGADDDDWGAFWNSNADTLDAALVGGGPFLPLTGGTVDHANATNGLFAGIATIDMRQGYVGGVEHRTWVGVSDNGMMTYYDGASLSAFYAVPGFPLAAVAAVRTSDQSGAGTANIGFASYAVTDGASASHGSSWSFYGSNRRMAGAGTTIGMELSMGNLAPTVELNPHLTGAPGSTIGLWLSSGAEAYEAGLTVYPGSSALNVVSNGSTWGKGLVFGANALTPAPGTGVMKAIQLPEKGEIQWVFNAAGARGGFIRSDATATSLGILFHSGDFTIVNDAETVRLLEVTTSGASVTGTFTASGNGLFQSGFQVYGAALFSSAAQAQGGLSFPTAPASATDLSKHLDLAFGTHGMNVYNGVLNFNVGASYYFQFLVGGTAAVYVDANALTAAKALQVTPGGPTWTTGSAVPSSTQPVGSIYSRVSTWAAGATLYVSKGAGAWTPVAGV
jgi:hypothetical protein